MLVLKTLTVQPMHGYGIARHLLRLSQDVIQVAPSHTHGTARCCSACLR
jgi:DNA-binding PadR family transcriptional regulator